MKTFMLMLAVTLVSGCATEGKFKENMDSWLGSDADTLVMKMGQPMRESQMPSGNGKILTYESIMNTMYGPAYCTTSFYTNSSNVITSYNYSGNMCKSK